MAFSHDVFPLSSSSLVASVTVLFKLFLSLTVVVSGSASPLRLHCDNITSGFFERLRMDDGWYSGRETDYGEVTRRQ